MAITLLGFQPIDFTYKENDPCENLSTMCLQYETADNPMFQIRANGGDAPLVTIIGVGNTSFNEASLTPTITGEFYTYEVNFQDLGITEGCFEICVYNPIGSNVVTNGMFNTDLTDWLVINALILDVASHTDDSVTLSASGGTDPYGYSIDGITYGGSTAFTGLTSGEVYTFYVKDSYGVIDAIEFELADCSEFAGSESSELVDYFAIELKTCEAADFV